MKESRSSTPFETIVMGNSGISFYRRSVPACAYPFFHGATKSGVPAVSYVTFWISVAIIIVSSSVEKSFRGLLPRVPLLSPRHIHPRLPA